MADNDTIRAAYLDEAFRGFRGYRRMAEGALAQLSDEDFFYLPDPESNSLALVVKHVAGNLRSRWTDFLTTDGEKPDRNRDQEFILAEGDTRENLMRRWEQSFDLVLDTINRSLMHIAYHVGQILYLGKHRRGADWKTLSVPKGKSAEFNAMRPEDRKYRNPEKG